MSLCANEHLFRLIVIKYLRCTGHVLPTFGDFVVFILCRFEYLFNFDSTFEIHDDIEVLKRMGMALGLESGRCSPEQLKTARALVPKALEPYVIGQNMKSLSFLSAKTKMSCLSTFI